MNGYQKGDIAYLICGDIVKLDRFDKVFNRWFVLDYDKSWVKGRPVWSDNDRSISVYQITESI